ncbi:MAG: hypothetical protein HQ475_04495 [SAR202 cluster bacterium]|nr:hypothetical protein [SAR202 cluster bacterium]
MSSRFTEQETDSYYDSEDAIYRSFWDEDGSVHWACSTTAQATISLRPVRI